jgi:NAD(P)-dependent dehydrogenase (short-subunit alcohol dehydrogenase family)
MNLAGKTVIVTGGGRGLGRAIALELAKEGCNIVVSSRSKEELENVEKEIESRGSKALGLKLDLSVEENIAALVSTTIEHFRTVDILINNAGIIIPKAFLEVTPEEWDLTMNINLRSAFLLSQKVLSIMKEKKNGYIINISSTVALGVPSNLAAYGASKCGMAGLSQALYEAAKEYGVKVSTIYPGITDTKMVRDTNPPTNPNQWMLPEDIAYCVMFLLGQSDRMIVRDVVPWSTGYDKI